MEFTKETYHDLLDEQVYNEDYNTPTKEKCKVAIAKIGFVNSFETDGSLTMKEVIEDVDVYDVDGSSFFMVKKDVDGEFPTAFHITESIAFSNLDEFISYLVDMGDVDEDKIDRYIYDVDVDYYVTSNENIL
jgi:hypothetical protein